MPNVRGITSVFERVKNLLNGYSPLTTYLKQIYIHKNNFYEAIPDVLSPAIILNDNGETFLDAGGNPASIGSKNVIKTRVYNIQIIAVVKYLIEEAVLIGDASSIGIIDFSHLIEDALNSDKTLSGNLWDLTYEGWEAVDILDTENQSLFALGRQTTLLYNGKPEQI